MVRQAILTLLELFRARPAKGWLFTVVPTLLAIFQLGNSFVYDLSFTVSIPFAAVMIGVAILCTQYHVAELNRARLEFGPGSAD